jgi:phosphate acetyltransferase
MGRRKETSYNIAMANLRILLPEDDPVIDRLKEAVATENFGAGFDAELVFKPMSLEDAAKELDDGKADIVISGAVEDSADVIRAAIFFINKPKGLRQLISSFFVMEKGSEDPIFFADCAVNEKPSPEQLSEIAEQTARSVQQLGFEPVVAFLSLSTFGSASKLESVQQVAEAAGLFRQSHPEIISYGEIQVDAALDKAVFSKKAKKAGVELTDGKMPNVFIFPDGQSGNIAYKLVERLGGYTAVGPMLNGVALDWHDLSRGVSLPGLKRSVEYAARLHRARKAR